MGSEMCIRDRAHAKSVAGVEWNGQTIQLVGDPAILGAASTDDVEV